MEATPRRSNKAMQSNGPFISSMHIPSGVTADQLPGNRTIISSNAGNNANIEYLMRYSGGIRNNSMLAKALRVSAPPEGTSTSIRSCDTSVSADNMSLGVSSTDAHLRPNGQQRYNAICNKVSSNGNTSHSLGGLGTNSDIIDLDRYQMNDGCTPLTMDPPVAVSSAGSQGIFSIGLAESLNLLPEMGKLKRIECIDTSSVWRKMNRGAVHDQKRVVSLELEINQMRKEKRVLKNEIRDLLGRVFEIL